MSPPRLLSALLVTSAVLSVELLVAANSPSPSSSSVATPSPQNGNSGELTQNKTELKAAAKALVESGGPLAYLGMAVSIWGMTAGVDPSGAFRHGQWIAGAVNMKGLDNNFTKCGEI